MKRWSPCATLFVLLLWTPAMSQESVRIAFNLPAQSLGDAVRAIGEQLEINVFFDPKDAENVRGPAVKVVGNVDDALKLLLAGSGLKYRHLDANTIVVLPATSGTSSTVSSAPRGKAWLRVVEGRPPTLTAQVQP